jgi:ATP-binding cassette, subfamily F, member 3
MRPDESAYDHLSALLPAALPEVVRARLGGFGFGEDKAFVPIAELSGGERARLNLALVTHDAPALLMLDEPTNHLDLETREALVEAINAFEGAVVLVSHDWHLIELVAERLWLVANGTVRPFDGDLDDYRQLVLDRAEPVVTTRSAPIDDRRGVRQRAAVRRRALDPLRQRARAAEAAVTRLTCERDRLDRGLADTDTLRRNGAAIADTLKRRAELCRLIAKAEAEWLDAEEALERQPLD